VVLELAISGVKEKANHKKWSLSFVDLAVRRKVTPKQGLEGSMILNE
jgi:hypothetical protein